MATTLLRRSTSRQNRPEARAGGPTAGSGTRHGRAAWGRRRRRHRARRLLGAAVALVVLGALGLGVLIATSPSVSNAPRLVNAILSAHHAPSDNGVIPTRVAKALLATEDSRYYHDPALDPLGVARAVTGMVTGNGNDGGATIELQLAKMLYAPGTDIRDELKQVGVAFRLDAAYGKSAILAMYLNAAYFGDGAYGITAAAEHYFGVPAGRLSWAQASLLAGLVQAPSEYDPHGHLHLARSRQSHVLDRLVATGVLSRAQARLIYDQPLDPRVRFFG